MGICTKPRPFNHIFGADRILRAEHDIEASKMQGRARGCKGERKTDWRWQNPHAAQDHHLGDFGSLFPKCMFWGRKRKASLLPGDSIRDLLIPPSLEATQTRRIAREGHFYCPKNPEPSKVASCWEPQSTPARGVQTPLWEGPMILRVIFLHSLNPNSWGKRRGFRDRGY